MGEGYNSIVALLNPFSCKTRQSTRRAQTSLAEADHYPHLSFHQLDLQQLDNMHNECRALVKG